MTLLLGVLNRWRLQAAHGRAVSAILFERWLGLPLSARAARRWPIIVWWAGTDLHVMVPPTK